MSKKWLDGFLDKITPDKYANTTGVERLKMLHSFWNSEWFEKLGDPSKTNFEKIVWELEYILGLNEKPCLRCGNKPQHGEYYCDNCTQRKDHKHYCEVVQRMHEEKYNIKKGSKK